MSNETAPTAEKSKKVPAKKTAVKKVAAKKAPAKKAVAKKVANKTFAEKTPAKKPKNVGEVPVTIVAVEESRLVGSEPNLMQIPKAVADAAIARADAGLVRATEVVAQAAQAARGFERASLSATEAAEAFERAARKARRAPTEAEERQELLDNMRKGPQSIKRMKLPKPGKLAYSRRDLPNYNKSNEFPYGGFAHRGLSKRQTHAINAGATSNWMRRSTADLLAEGEGVK